MRIGKYTLRKPWTKEVEVPLEEELYWAVRKSIGEDIACEIAMEYDGDDREVWLTDILSMCIDIARKRGQK